MPKLINLTAVNTRELTQRLVDAIEYPYTIDEKRAMIQWLLEARLDLPRSQILAGTRVTAKVEVFTRELERLNRGEPLQYILGYTEFRGRRFRVSPDVLIPRPETELLVDLALKSLQGLEQPSIWDIGTGSGCIAVTLALELSQARVYASDVSGTALVMARHNATQLSAPVEFFQHDIIEDDAQLRQLDAVVSNPPYIPRAEQSALSATVTTHEPHLALFVPDDDPLLFHRVIAQKSRKSLKAGGLIILEINEALGNPAADVLVSSGYRHVSSQRDLDGKDRFVTGRWLG